VNASELKGEGIRHIDRILGSKGWMRVGRETKFSRRGAPGIEVRFNYRFDLRDRPALATVTPYVEIVHDEIEKFRALISGKPLYTINAQIQTLMEDSHAHYRWVFESETDLECPARRLVEDSLDYGVPFSEQFQTLADITSGLERLARGKRTIMRESLAIAYCLQGKLDQASSVLSDDIEAARSNPRDVAHEQLGRYEELFGVPISI
jgi:hypothetical protein